MTWRLHHSDMVVTRQLHRATDPTICCVKRLVKPIGIDAWNCCYCKQAPITSSSMKREVMTYKEWAHRPASKKCAGDHGR
jgi:hypothetical protein